MTSSAAPVSSNVGLWSLSWRAVKGRRIPHLNHARRNYLVEQRSEMDKVTYWSCDTNDVGLMWT